MGYVGAALAAALLGWLTGMMTLKRSSRWCPTHGTTLSCEFCAGSAPSVERRRRV